jgi:hypothetical protein
MKVTLATAWTDPKGKVHAADSTVDIERSGDASNLITRGLARLPETKPSRRSGAKSQGTQVSPDDTASTGSDDTPNASTGTKRKVKS